MTYWQKRDLAKEQIASGLRQTLLDQYGGLPVIVLRNRIDTIRRANKEWVHDLLVGLDCDDFNVSWRIFFDYTDDSDGVARVSDFHILVEGT